MFLGVAYLCVLYLSRDAVRAVTHLSSYMVKKVKGKGKVPVVNCTLSQLL